MSNALVPWDYLIVTASNSSQARAYETQLALRRQLGFLGNARNVLVVDDPQGRRIGSGGSTLCCLMEVLNREMSARQPAKLSSAQYLDECQAILRTQRILIIHAGGDSRRLPAYGPCGKIFIPVADDITSALGVSLFDRLAPEFMSLPPGPSQAGQIIVTAGDALILFEPEKVEFNQPGLTAVTCPATPEAASKHGVFCPRADGGVNLYLQKPSVADQKKYGAISSSGQSLLDIGIMSFDAQAAMRMLEAFGVQPSGGKLEWSASGWKDMLELGIDIYREVCCALGSNATFEHLFAQAKSAGSKWTEAALKRVFKTLHPIPFNLSIVPQARFLHFGTTRQLVSSGVELRLNDEPTVAPTTPISINNRIVSGGEIAGSGVWVEGCRIAAPLHLAGNNVVIGLEIDEPLTLRKDACIDALQGKSRAGAKVWFVRCHGVDDKFKDTLPQGAAFCGIPLLQWLESAGAKPEDVWDSTIPQNQYSLWDARVFPAVPEHSDYRSWLWMFDPANASPEQKKAFLQADRYSAAEIATLATQDDFFTRRHHTRVQSVQAIKPLLPSLFQSESAFSARELAWQLAQAEDRPSTVASLLSEIRTCATPDDQVSVKNFQYARILHSFGSAIKELAPDETQTIETILPGLEKAVLPDLRQWLETRDFAIGASASARKLGERACDLAFSEINRTILHSHAKQAAPPRNSLRKDETVWGRSPARLDLGGGWTDTPPYTLEFGGEVLNAAINLNGQPPIHCYGRVISEPCIRIFSIDTGLQVEIRELEQLMDFRNPSDPFGLAKAALSITGFSPEMTPLQKGKTLRQILEDFGGGLELTTLVGIPKGSGLGTSSILGATIVAVLHRIVGHPLTDRELFHEVLRLEQALTTGGGWQDQVGGVMPGVKITYTQPGLIPDPRIHYVPCDILNPRDNGGTTLLYYTGITRLAKNILRQVVGNYLDRNREVMAALEGLRQVATGNYDAMARKNAAEFAELSNAQWRLTQILCPDATNEQVEELLDRVRPFTNSARLIGAGSGGFMLMLCKSPLDAVRLRADLEARPLNECSRFFDFDINNEGLKVTSC